MYGIYEGGSVIAEFVAPFAIRSNHPVFTSDTFSLSRYISRRTAQRWEIDTHLSPLSANAQDLFVHLVTKGYSTSFTILTPQNYGVILAKTSNSTPSASGSLGTSTVNIVQGSNNGFIPKGTFIKFSNHAKIYMTTTSLNDSPVSSTLSIYPPLRTAVSSTSFVTNNVQMTCFYDLETLTGMSYSDGILQDVGQVRIVEAI